MEEKVKEFWYRVCANCGRQVLVEKPGDRCYWCGKNASKKEVIMAEVSCDRMTRLDKSKYIKKHLTEIMEDIRNLPKKEVLEKWGFRQSTFNKLRKKHAPELISTGGRPKKNQEPQPSSQAELTEHERYLILIGYQMAIREFLKADKN